jgi:hypothetical protein
MSRNQRHLDTVERAAQAAQEPETSSHELPAKTKAKEATDSKVDHKTESKHK